MTTFYYPNSQTGIWKLKKLWKLSLFFRFPVVSLPPKFMLMDEKTRNRILETTADLFFSRGIKETTMDHIARQLGMSKKTLYKYYAHKTDLVRAVMEYVFSGLSGRIKEICLTEGNPYEQFFKIRNVVIDMLRNTTGHTNYYQLRTWYPEIARELEKRKRQSLMECLDHNLHTGHKAGYYRKSIDDEFVKRLYVGSYRMLMDQELFPPDQFPRDYIGHEFLKFFLSAISTKKGREQLKLMEKKYKL